MRHYLDHNATTPLGDAAREQMRALLDQPLGNPSSIHARGRTARSLVEVARADVAALVGARPDAVIFTSGGSEAIALGLIGLARRSRARAPSRTRVLVGAAEHPAVHGAASVLAHEGFSIERLAVDAGGRVAVDRLVVDDDVALLAVQAANHETGGVVELEALVAAAGAVPIFCDAVQAAGKIPIAMRGVAALALASHKLYGPTGVGALVLGDGVDVDAVVPGGPQERGRRPGTEPALVLAGFGAAAREAAARLNEESARQRALRDELERGLIALGARVFGADGPRTPNTTSCAFVGRDGQLVAMALDLAGFEISTGAACSSGTVAPSPVLLAAGISEDEARAALRISIGRGTDAATIAALLAALPPILARVLSAKAAAAPRP